jgi:[ribosomal protein S18]-alanine N-acetyltransferase
MTVSPQQAAVTLRRALPGDAAAIAALHARCFPRGWDQASIATLVADPTCLTLIVSAPENGSCHGLLIARVAADEAELLTLAVDAAHRRQGLARALLGAAIASLKLCGAKQLFLEVETGNEAAEALYRGFGAKGVGHRPAYYEHGADAAIFSLAL